MQFQLDRNVDHRVQSNLAELRLSSDSLVNAREVEEVDIFTPSETTIRLIYITRAAGTRSAKLSKGMSRGDLELHFQGERARRG